MRLMGNLPVLCIVSASSVASISFKLPFRSEGCKGGHLPVPAASVKRKVCPEKDHSFAQNLGVLCKHVGLPSASESTCDVLAEKLRWVTWPCYRRSSVQVLYDLQRGSSPAAPLPE